jgi:hypothetical protein
MYSTFPSPKYYIFSFYNDLMIISMRLCPTLFSSTISAIPHAVLFNESHHQETGIGVQKSLPSAYNPR